MSNSATVTLSSSRLFGRKQKQPLQAESPQDVPAKPKPKKFSGFKVAKYEVAEDKIKFFNPKGLFKKRWVVEKEYPIYEITSIESIGNWLSLNWRNEAYQFMLKKGESFAKLQEQVKAMQSECQNANALNERASQRKADLLNIIQRSLPIVDASFDILIALHAQRVDWQQIEAYVQTLGLSFNITPATLPPLSINLAAIDEAVKRQVAKDTSKEALSVLKTVHGYFTGLKPEDDLANFNPNFEHAKAAVLAYYTLNDLLLAKVVGEKDSKKEVAYLEEVLKPFEGTGVKIDSAAFLSAIDKAAVEVERDNAIFSVRTQFREQLKQLYFFIVLGR
jgi:hypothetical protein